MKTLFLCCESAVQNHLDEEYDEILYVTDNITTENIEQWIFRIKDAVRLLSSKVPPGNLDKSIKVIMDCPSPYNWIMSSIQIEMSTNEQIALQLPEMSPNPNPDDIIKENNEICDKIKKAQQESEEKIKKERAEYAKVYGVRSDDGSETVDGTDS